MKHLWALAVISLLFLAACGGANSANSSSSNNSDKPAGPDWSTPQGAMKELQAAFASGESARLLACFSKGAREDMKRKIDRDVGPVVAAGGSFKIDYSEADLKQEGEKYTITVKLTVVAKSGGTSGTEDEDFTLIKEDGLWKFDRN